jgi:hypothetical protein
MFFWRVDSWRIAINIPGKERSLAMAMPFEGDVSVVMDTAAQGQR